MELYAWLDIIALALAAVHFEVPLVYYWIVKSRWIRLSWNIRRDLGYTPRVTIVVPTYNEARLIWSKLEDLKRQDYPRDRLEIVVVDSASTDGTSDIVRDWAEQNPDVNLKLIVEPVRRGKAHALNVALRHAAGDIVIITDVDARWSSEDTLRRVVSYFADPSVGAVSCVKVPAGQEHSIEQCYRQYYNIIRIGESKKYATPIFHGELAAFRKDLLLKVGGFPLDVGADDSHTATKIALLGYRAIVPEDVLAIELVPKEQYSMWRIRRAQHLVQHFTKTLRHIHKAQREFRPILLAESFLHLLNPWILLTALILTLTSAIVYTSLLSIALLMTYLALHMYRPFRTWTTTQHYLVIATIRNLKKPELVWKKQEKM